MLSFIIPYILAINTEKPYVWTGEIDMDERLQIEQKHKVLTMTAPEVAARMGCSRQHIYDLHRKGQLPFAFKFGGNLLIGKKAFKQWLEEKFGTDLDDEFYG